MFVVCTVAMCQPKQSNNVKREIKPKAKVCRTTYSHALPNIQKQSMILQTCLELKLLQQLAKIQSTGAQTL